ncbi:hypothetical protein [Stenotrophomonas sp. AS1]|uniref:hypothetical protein n=1 Tax=Stenotrophomonas sp. AS1 TaxID=3029188 RepID=UPI003B7EFCFD
MAMRSIRIAVSVAWWWRWYVGSVALASYLTNRPPDMDKVEHWARRAITLREGR